MSRWFRFYDTALDDPKVQRLPGDLFKHWVNLLCLTSRNGGALPCLTDISFALRITDAEAESVLADFEARNLLDRDEETLQPHNWNGRQFKSDASTERVKAFRERRRNVSPTVSETPPEAETDTETDTEIAAAPSAPVVSLDKIENACREAAGLSESISPALFDLSPILGILDQGADLESEIIPALRAKPNPKAKSWSYFVPQIQDARARRKAAAAAGLPDVPPPKARAGPRDPVSFLQAGRGLIDEIRDADARFDQQTKQPAVQIGYGGCRR